MSEPQNVRSMLAEAERAASIGDLVSAEGLLRDAAELQEGELGPLHPDLANTLNNLAVIAEKAGRPDDAERFYRRAVAIASASLPADDPMIAASRQNLEEFCHAHGRPIERSALIVPAASEASAPPTQAPAPPTQAPAPPAQAPASPTQAPAPPTPTPAAYQPPPVSATASRVPATFAIGLLALVTVALFVERLWSPPETPTTVPAAALTPAPAAEPARPAPDVAVPIDSAPIDRTPAPKVDRAPAPARAPGAISLVTVQLCRNFSTTDWRCDPAGESTPQGSIVLYTRVRSPRDGVVVHHWYRGDTLRQSVQLRVGANTAEGYRTYSRQTVDRGDWRVEVRSVAGDLLHEQRLTVR